MSDTPHLPSDPGPVRLALTERIRKVVLHAPGVLAEDADAIHDMRVASRRLRAALRVWGASLNPEHTASLLEQVRGITRDLGRARELDVTLGLLREEAKRATGPWAAALETAVEALKGLRAAEKSACAAATTTAQGWPDADALAAQLIDGWNGRADELLRARLDRDIHRLWKAQRRWVRKGHDEDLHATRVAFKKFRYTAELFVPQCPPMATAVAELKAAQEALGDWNDFRVAALEVGRLEPVLPSREARAIAVEALEHRAAEYLATFELQAKTFFTTEKRQALTALWNESLTPVEQA